MESKQEEGQRVVRNMNGLYTLEEAATAIASQLGWHQGAQSTLLQQMTIAANTGQMTVRHPHTELPFITDQVHTYYELVTQKDVNAWAEGCDAPWRWEQSQSVAPVLITDPDVTLLASRKKLIDAFGSFTGMDNDWFSNIKDTPALLEARRVKGQGGRGHIVEPLFCPYTVLQWLINPARRKGRMLGEAKGWELFEKHFPLAYNTFSIGDPRD